MSVRVERWQRYGHDCLYVRGRDGLQYGWVDLATGLRHPADAVTWPAEVDLAVEQWKMAHGFTVAGARRPEAEATSSAASPTSETSGARVPRPGRRRPSTAQTAKTQPQPDRGRDLAKNRAGSAAMTAARDRTTWWRRAGRALGIRTADGAWREGAEGERQVGKTLAMARFFGWRSLHAVPVGTRGSDIDHVLIGPGGVVTVNTKHHRGKAVKAGRLAVFVDGRETRYAENSLHEGQRASRLLTAAVGRPVEVTPIVVVVGARRLRGHKTQGVRILRHGDLLFWLAFRRRRLGRAERRAMFEVARREATWR